jgi:acetyl esterase/lipase
MKKTENIVYGELIEAQTLDVYLPDSSALAVFVYFHGGGLESGSKKDAEIFAKYLTERGIALISANYRMYPNAKFPDFIYDAAQAVAWAKRFSNQVLDCNRLYVGGSSAGGYISMMLCFDRQYLASVGLDNTAISGYFHDAGQPTSHFNVLKQNNIDPRRIIVDETAPLYFVGLEKEYPPMRFVVSDNDMKGRYEQTMLMLSTLSHFDYQNYDYYVAHGTHCEYCSKLDENGESILGQFIYDFIKQFD